MTHTTEDVVISKSFFYKKGVDGEKIKVVPTDFSVGNDSYYCVSFRDSSRKLRELVYLLYGQSVLEELLKNLQVNSIEELSKLRGKTRQVKNFDEGIFEF